MTLECAVTRVKPATDDRSMQGERFELLNQLGVGGFAEVWRCRHRSSGQERAVKIMFDMSNTVLHECLQTRRALQTATSDRIPQFYGLAEADLLDANGAVVRTVDMVAMELVVGGNIGHFTPANRRGIPWPDVAIHQVVKDVGAALVALHRAGVIHCDVKPDNILFDWSGECKLCDFGVAVFMEDHRDPSQPMPCAGTPTYMAPEMTNEHCRYDTAVDVWGLGAVAYELLLGITPVLTMPALRNSPFAIFPAQILTILGRMESVPLDAAKAELARQEALNPDAPKRRAGLEHDLIHFFEACLAVARPERVDSRQMMQLAFVGGGYPNSRRALVEWLRLP